MQTKIFALALQQKKVIHASQAQKQDCFTCIGGCGSALVLYEDAEKTSFSCKSPFWPCTCDILHYKTQMAGHCLTQFSEKMILTTARCTFCKAEISQKIPAFTSFKVAPNHHTTQAFTLNLISRENTCHPWQFVLGHYQKDEILGEHTVCLDFDSFLKVLDKGTANDDSHFRINNLAGSEIQCTNCYSNALEKKIAAACQNPEETFKAF